LVVLAHQLYSDLGADIVMESITRFNQGKTFFLTADECYCDFSTTHAFA